MGSSRSKWLEGMFEDRSTNTTSAATKPWENQNARNTVRGLNSSVGWFSLEDQTKPKRQTQTVFLEWMNNLEEYAFSFVLSLIYCWFSTLVVVCVRMFLFCFVSFFYFHSAWWKRKWEKGNDTWRSQLSDGAHPVWEPCLSCYGPAVTKSTTMTTVLGCFFFNLFVLCVCVAFRREWGVGWEHIRWKPWLLVEARDAEAALLWRHVT